MPTISTIVEKIRLNNMYKKSASSSSVKKSAVGSRP